MPWRTTNNYSLSFFFFIFLFTPTNVFAQNSHSSEFDGVNDYLFVNDNPSLSITGDLTAELWVNFNSFNENDQGILISKYGGGSNERAYQFGYFKNTSDGKQYFESRISDDGTGPNTSVVTLEYTLATSTWYHIAFVYKAATGTIDVYVATTSALSHTFAGTMSGHRNSIKDSSSQFRVASSHGAGSIVYFDGFIDEVRIWSDIRTTSEIYSNFKTELNGDESNLAGYWKLNNSLNDSTSNGNNLSNNGGVTFTAFKPFPIPPSIAIDPSPSIASTSVATSTEITWSPGTGLTQQAVYFGTSSDPGLNEFKGIYSSTTTFYDPGILQASTTYYWRIDTANSEATTTGNLWNFSTIAEPENSHSIGLNGIDDYLSVADSSSLSITGDLTIEFWAKFDSFNIDDQGILVSKWGDYGGGNNQRAYQFGYYKTSGGTGYFYPLTSADGTNVTSATIQYDLATSTWYHLAFIYTAASGTVSVYVATTSDSSHALVGTSSGFTTSLKDTVSEFQIGSSDGSGNAVYLDGIIDEVRVWSKTKSKLELDTDYTTELTGSETNLEAYWNFNNTLNDATINGNNLTNNNGATFVTSTPF